MVRARVMQHKATAGNGILDWENKLRSAPGMTNFSQCLMPIPTMSIRMVSSTHHAALPDVRCDLVWAGEKLLLCGPQTRCQSNFSGQSIMLVSIEPLVASAWLSTPLGELTDQIIPLMDIKPAVAGGLSEAFFRGNIQSTWGPINGDGGWAPDNRLELAVSRLRRGASVASAAAALSLTPRHLVRLFRHQLGLPPRQFARIIRLRRAVILIKRGATIVEAAASAGFADQPHFTREVNAFAGRPPTVLIPHVANVQDGVRGSPLD
jgi:AraC-like DNA-binding protein